MSNRVLFLKHGYVNENAPLLNGLGRFIPQLQRITLKFCKEQPKCYGVREFIEQDIVRFAEQNPHVAVYLKPRRNRDPVLVAEYLNGHRHWQSLRNYSREQVAGWIDVCRTASGREFQYQQKLHYTDNPSIQGMWNSYVNVEPEVAIAKFPNSSLSEPIKREPTATQQLIELFKQQQQQASSSSSNQHHGFPEHEQEQLNRAIQSEKVHEL